MEDNKEKTGFWKNWMTIAVLLAVVVMVAWFNSQSPATRSESDKNISIGNGTHVQGKSTDVQVENSNVVPMDNDTFFKTWIAVSFKAINENLNCVSKASKARNVTSVGTCGRLLEQNSNMSLKDIDKHGANTSMRTVLDEYKKALEDYRIGGIDLEVGARNNNMSEISYAIGYIQDGDAHIKLVDRILSGNNVTSGNLSHLKTGANTTGQ